MHRLRFSTRTEERSIKVYLAARFPKREELEKLVPEIEKIGWKINARWVFGGEEGLTRTDIAMLDIEDVESSDAIILFTEPYGSLVPGGGRFVEFGYALACDKKCFVIGEYENVFTHHPAVKVYPTLGDLLRDQSTQP